ncbi:MAG: DUF302 domain-containing protein [Deltaproteobacteria bacterium]|nr:DUF302 domain-containing protein [Deltaproteobacteria bacterium]
MARYSISRKLDCGYSEALERARAALKEEGLWIVSEINVAELVKNSLNKNFRGYTILGACDPPLAYKALTVEADIGLMIPCNIIIHENDEGGSTVAAIDPVISMAVIENPAIALVAKEVRERIDKAIGRISLI